QGGSANGSIAIDNGRLKVNVTNAYNGAQYRIGNSFSVGDEVRIELTLDKGNTDGIRIMVIESDGQNWFGYALNVNAASGDYSFTYTIGSMPRLDLKIDKRFSAVDDGVGTYFYIDNVLATTGTLGIIEENNYYPFGLKHKGYNDVVSASANSVAQRFRYNGKELEESLGIDWYEMDMRQYDPAIARWNSIDPVVHHEYSTYSAFDNNPVFWADPSGADGQLSDNFYAFGGHKVTWGEGFGPSYEESKDNDNDSDSGDCCGKLKKAWADFRNWVNDALTWGGTEEEMAKGEEARAMFEVGGETAQKMWEMEKEVFSYLPGGAVATALLEGDYEGAAGGFTFELAASFIPFGNLIKNGGKSIVKFSGTALNHMNDVNRFVPASILDDVAKNMPGIPDPQGAAGRTMHYAEIIIDRNIERNGRRISSPQTYNLEVLYNEATNTVEHFLYTRDAIGNLPKR
ncbi:RHS repeat-associated core domain-containing protein, partial [Winogradskyella sp.]|uniref:RHS repeat-associated core domain-containing protein n=1 Tax=Winogradskyella sp. TaxID=1883156 RepID=UPI002623B752